MKQQGQGSRGVIKRQDSHGLRGEEQQIRSCAAVLCRISEEGL